MANRHLSYDEFKNIFGDLGVTEWTKYNWLDNNFNLPSNLVRVEYIEFDGTQVVHTNVYSSLTVECKQEAEIAFTNTTQATAGTGADYGYYFGIAGGLFCVAQFSAATPTKTADTNRHSFINVITPTKQYLYIDGSEHIAARTITTENDAFYIGGISYNQTYFAKMKVYSYKLYKDNVLVRNFVPVFDTTTGKYGLYDLVGRQFYGSYIGTLTGPYANAVKLSTLNWSKSGSYQNCYWASTADYTNEQRQKSQLANSDNYNYYLSDEVYGPAGTLMLNSLDYTYREVHAHSNEDLTVKDFVATLGDSYVLY